MDKPTCHINSIGSGQRYSATGVHPDALAVLRAAGKRLQAQGAQTLVLAGAVLCGGYAAELGASCGCPVFDGMVCAVDQARGLLGCRL